MAKRKKLKEIKPRDPNAQAMWGRCRSQVFKDKTKYSRKVKHVHKEV